MKNIKALTLAFLLSLFSSSYALAEYGITVGVTGSMAMIDASGQETEGGEITRGETSNNTGIGSVFVEYNNILDSGFSLGIDYIPGSADVSENTQTRRDTETSVTDTTTTTNTSRVQKAQAELDNHITYYATYTGGNGVYVKAGYVQVDLNTLESLGTGSAYGNDTLDGISVGAGVEFDVYANTIGRLEISHIDYGDIEVKSSVARAGVATNNLIEADLDVTLLSASLGYKF
tara:strand:- start:3999 stop:4694 length:696 start_codon:yes stop_codon:yes gene_type:complete